MSESRMMKCDKCGKTIERTEWVIPSGWMHIEAWHRPVYANGDHSGCGGYDLCFDCIARSTLASILKSICSKDYDEHTVKRNER